MTIYILAKLFRLSATEQRKANALISTKGPVFFIKQETNIYSFAGTLKFVQTAPYSIKIFLFLSALWLERGIRASQGARQPFFF